MERDPAGDAPPAGPGTTRRDLLLRAAGGAAALAAGIGPAHADEKDAPKPLPRRPFGKTGAEVTVFGLGCHPLGGLRDEDAGIAVVRRALEAGCTYIDTAPSYARGRSETRVGKALKAFGAKRLRAQGVMLATKTNTRTRDAAWRDLEGSLKRLQVDRIDLLQVHAIRGAADLEQALDTKRGPLKALHEAREQKLIRWIGVTGHWDPVVMAQTFQRYDFDSILFPLNCVDPHYVTRSGRGSPGESISFLRQTLPPAVKHGLARVAMKVFSAGRLVNGKPAAGVKPVRAEDCLRFTYGLDIATCIVGCKTTAEVDLAVRVARENRPLSAQESAALVASTRPHAGRGTEWYKRP